MILRKLTKRGIKSPDKVLVIGNYTFAVKGKVIYSSDFPKWGNKRYHTEVMLDLAKSMKWNDEIAHLEYQLETFRLKETLQTLEYRYSTMLQYSIKVGVSLTKSQKYAIKSKIEKLNKDIAKRSIGYSHYNIQSILKPKTTKK